MSYNDDAKMKLLKEAWNKMSEGDVTYGAKVPDATDPNGKNGLKGTKATGTAVSQGPSARATVAKATGGAENLAEGEEDVDSSGAPVGAADLGADAGAGADLGGAPDMGADLGAAGAAPVGSPWDQLVAAVEQMKTALQAIAAEEAGEAGGADLGAEGDIEDPTAGAADMGEEPPIDEVANSYLQEAKKKIAEKKKKACKEEECKEEGAKAAPKGFVPFKKGQNKK